MDNIKKDNFGTEVKSLHKKAMTLAANKDWQGAFIVEKNIADYLKDKSDCEPTRSVVHRSAAWMAFNGGLLEDAKYYAEKVIEFDIIKHEGQDILDEIILKTMNDNSKIINNKYTLLKVLPNIHQWKISGAGFLCYKESYNSKWLVCEDYEDKKFIGKPIGYAVDVPISEVSSTWYEFFISLIENSGWKHPLENTLIIKSK